jgi:undecaprenyl-diphosphatase
MRTNRSVLGLALALSCAAALFAESADPFPYALDPVKDSAWIVGDLALYGASLYLDSIRPAPDSAGLDSSKIPWFDALYTTSHSAALNTTTDVLVVALAALPAAAVPGLSFRRMAIVGTMYSETIGLAYSLDSIIKAVVVRNRPYAYSSTPPSDIGSVDISSSFPSLHSTVAFASAVFAGSVFDTLHPDSPYRWAVWGTGIGVATLVSTLRVASGDHFVSDVVTGAALGSLIGFGVPYLHRLGGGNRGEAEAGLAVSVSPTGFTARYRLAP